MMNTKKILDDIIKNGGATYNKELKKVNLKNGYFVSLIGFEYTFNLNNINIYELDEKIKLYQTTLLKNEFIGFWIDNGLLYIDISKHFKSYYQAIDVGINNKQLAIYDIKKDKNIYLLKKCYILYKYNKYKNDIIYMNEYNTKKEILKVLNISNDYLKHKILKDVESEILENNLIDNKYIIIEDKKYINE